MRAIRVTLAILALLLRATPGSAQSVSQVLDFLLTNQSIQTGSVATDLTAAQATAGTISDALLASLATLPVTSSSAPFSYRLNPSLGTVERSTEAFGPFFIDRAASSGRLVASGGLSFEHLHFTSLDSRNLRNGTLITTANQFSDESAPFDVDRLTLNLDADVATLYGDIGLTDRVEVGIAVPMVVLRLDGTRVDTYRGQTFTQAHASATSVGLADTVLRSKWTLLENRQSAFAAGVDVRLPTGQRDDLLGAGRAALKILTLGSLERGRFGVHGNLGFGVGGLADEVDYGAALTAAMVPRVTAIAELTGQWLDVPGNFETVSAPDPTIAGVNTLRLMPSSSRLHTLVLTPGFKWNVAETWVVVANATVPLLHDGLTAPVTPYIGLEYALGTF